MALKYFTGFLLNTNGTNWSNAASWSPTGVATSADDVIINGDTSGYKIIYGPGAALSLLIYNNVALNGAYTIGALTIGARHDSPGGLYVLAASSVTASSASVFYGPLSVSGTGSKLTITGGLSIGGDRSLDSNPSNVANDYFSVTGGGTAQVGSIVMVSSSSGAQVAVDGTSTLEIGFLGGVAAGTFRIDAGQTLSVSGSGTIQATNGIVNLGTVQTTGLLSVYSGMSGPGQLLLGAGARIDLLSNTPTTNDVVFQGPTGTLTIDRLGFYTGTNPALAMSAQGVIRGFVAGDTIQYHQFSGTPTLTGVSYSPGSGGLGTLTLYNTNVVIGSLSLAGDYTGQTFQAVADSITVKATVIGPGTAAPDAYSWIGTGSGLWSILGNWRDTTVFPASTVVVPGVNNLVTISNVGATQQVTTGPANAATLTVLGNEGLQGAFTIGSLTVGSIGTAGALQLLSGTTLVAGSVLMQSGPLAVTGAGTKLTVLNGIQIGGDVNTRANGQAFSVTGGAAAHSLSVLMYAPTSGQQTIMVDATSQLEIGVGGGGAAGQMLIQLNGGISGAGSITAAGSIINNGVILASGGTLTVNTAVSGAGKLSVISGGQLNLLAAATENVQFEDGAGTLSFTTVAGAAFGGARSALSEQGTIRFMTGAATLHYSSTAAGLDTLTTAVFRPAAVGTLPSAGVLTLSNAGGVIGTLQMADIANGLAFQVTGNAAAGYDIREVAATIVDPLFDAAFYLAHNPDVKAAGIDPYQHFLANGWMEGRDPGALFSVSYYLSHNPDVAAAGVNPLLHFSAVGYKEGRDPNAFFNTKYYLNQNPDVAAAGVDPLLHFMTDGWREGRDPSVLFSIRGYQAANPDVKAAGLDPLLHYLASGRAEGRAAVPAMPHDTGPHDLLVDDAYVYAGHPEVAAAGLDASAWFHAVGWKAGANPDALFDTSYYLTQNPDVAAAGLDPLAHFESNGWREGREPSLVFSDAKYLTAYPDVKAAAIDPLVHYLASGKAEGRMAFLAGGPAAADPLVNATYFDRQLGATLIPGGAAGAQQAAASYDATGWQKGVNPDALFDTKYYLSHNPDVAAAHINPLLHFEANGWKEGRDPSALFSTNKYLSAYTDVRTAGLDPLLHYVVSGQAEGRQAFAV